MQLDPLQVQQQIANLLLQYPELQEDAVLRADMIEAETDANELLTEIVRRIEDAKALRDGTKDRLDDLKTRKDRFSRRIDALRDLAFRIMDAASLRSVELPEATLSIRKGQLQIVGEPDLARLPDSLAKIIREPDKVAIKEALQSGKPVPGCELGNGQPSISIRIK